MSVTAGSRIEWAPISEVDPELWPAMVGERDRQHRKIELIASENYVFGAVLEAQGSWLTNKYAEGLPGKRYYGGCEYVDVVERLAQERALALFPGAEHVNVQPHSGAQANMAAYMAVLEPGDRILGMNLAHGGHLTHGIALNFSGRFFEVHAYGVREDDRASTTTRSSDRLRRSGPSSSSPVPAPTRGSSTSSAWRPSLTTWTRCSSSTWPTSPGSSRRASIRALPARRHRDHDHPQDAARPTRRPGLRPRRAAAGGDLPTSQPSRGRSPSRSIATSSRASRAVRLMHVIAAKAVALSSPSSDAVPRRPCDGPSRTRGSSPRRSSEHGRAGRLRRHGQPPDARGRDAPRRHRQGGRARSSTRSASPSTRTPSPSTRCRRIPRRASGWARRPRRREASARTRCASRRAHRRAPSRAATDTGRARRHAAPRSDDICARFPVPGLPDA